MQKGGLPCCISRRIMVGPLAAVLVVLATACGGKAPEPAQAPTVSGPSPAAGSPTAPAAAPATSVPPAASAPAPPAAVVTIKATEHPALGIILTDVDGRTLYLSTDDERRTSRCSGGCAEAFPPVLTVGDPAAGEGISAGRLDTITRDDGTTQVTYNGWPLYYFAADKGPTETMGQNVGDVWFAVSIHGGPIQKNAILRTSPHPELGTILVDASGRTTYLFTVDERSKSNCLGGCATAWPPLLTVGDPTAG